MSSKLENSVYYPISKTKECDFKQTIESYKIHQTSLGSIQIKFVNPIQAQEIEMPFSRCESVVVE